MKKICFISSCGGHFYELTQLFPVAEGHNSYLITEYNGANKDTVSKYGSHYFLKQQERRTIRFIFVFIYNVFKSFYILAKERPTHVITTGAGVAFPTCIFGKLFNAKVIYVESFARVYTKSITGRLLYKIVDRFYVQWPEQKPFYPNALYHGKVF